ncbi:MAG: hypothetical protein GY899_08935 [Verrucomicrobiaceae bacterium]|nr:hypothetical protein [Verrucomicrobiaceae bacterium]
MMVYKGCFWPVFLVVVLFSVGQSAAQLPTPRLDAMFPMGVRAGASVEVSLSGADLDSPGQLIFNHPGISAEWVSESRFSVKAAGDVPTGHYEVSFGGRYGVSASLLFSVSDREEMQVPPEAASPVGAPVINDAGVMNGRAVAGKAHYFKVLAKAGERIFIECFAERMVSRMDALIVVTDPGGIEVGRARETVGGDPLLGFTAKNDGEYLLRVSDFMARGGSNYHYRLVLRKGAQVDFVLPLSAQPGKKQSFHVYGRNLPGGVPSGDGLERIEVDVDVPSAAERCRTSLLKPVNVGMRGFHYRVGTGEGASNIVFIPHSALPVVIDAGANVASDEAQHLPFPCEASGRFYPNASSWFSFDAKKGQSYAVEVIAQRLSGSSDPVMDLEKVSVDKDGKQKVTKIGTADDEGKNIGGRRFPTSHRDPSYLFKADADVKVRVRIHDNYQTGNPYRLIIRSPKPGFDLLMSLPPPADNNAKSKKVTRGGIAIRRGQVGTIDVYALRRDGFNGAISLKVEGLPGSFETAPVMLAAGATKIGIPFKIRDDAPAWSGRVQVSGSAEIEGVEVRRQADSASLGWTVNDYDKERVLARVGDNLSVGSIEEKSPLVIASAGDKVWETSLGGKIDVPVKLAANAEIKDKITIKVIDFPGMGKKPPQVQIEKGKVEGNLPISFLNNKDGNQFKPGVHRFMIQASTKLAYRRDAEGAKMAEEEKKKAVAHAEATRKAVDPAKKTRDVAQQELKQARAANAETEEKKAAMISQAEAKANEAELALKKIEEDSKQAEVARKDAESRAKQAAERSKPKDLQFTGYSMPLTVKIEESPVRIMNVEPPAELMKGGKGEITVNVERRYGFTEEIKLQLKFADGVKGFVAPEATVAKEQTQAKVVIEAKADASVGELEVELIAKLKFNGIDLQSKAPVKMNISEPAPDPPNPAP